MIISDAKREVETMGSLASSQFTIKADAKAFKLLIDGLYSNKIRSIIREVCSNALDGHIKAGCADRPFKLTLPSVLDPTFSVRDYGCSMSHEMVMQVLTTLFSSTKDNSNDQVGGFGLGAKTPFAYTDTFGLTCWMDGRARLYNAFIGANSVPQLDLLMDEASDEETGVEVTFPVRTEDMSRFVSEAASVMWSFATRPICNNEVYQDRLKRRDSHAVLVRDGYIVGTGDGRRLSVRQGCVSYGIPSGSDLDRLMGAVHPNHLPNAGLELIVPIGSVSVTPSREQIAFDDQSIAFLKNQLRLAYDDMVQFITQEYKQAPRADLIHGQWKYASLANQLNCKLTGRSFFGQVIERTGVNFTKISRLVARKRQATASAYYLEKESIGRDRRISNMESRVGSLGFDAKSKEHIVILRAKNLDTVLASVKSGCTIYFTSDTKSSVKAIASKMLPEDGDISTFGTAQLIIGVTESDMKILWAAMGRVVPAGSFESAFVCLDQKEAVQGIVDIPVMTVTKNGSLKSISTRALKSQTGLLLYANSEDGVIKVFGKSVSKHDLARLYEMKSEGARNVLPADSKISIAVVAPTKKQAFLDIVGDRAVHVEDFFRSFAAKFSSAAWSRIAQSMDATVYHGKYTHEQNTREKVEGIVQVERSAVSLVSRLSSSHVEVLTPRARQIMSNLAHYKYEIAYAKRFVGHFMFAIRPSDSTTLKLKHLKKGDDLDIAIKAMDDLARAIEKRNNLASNLLAGEGLPSSHMGLKINPLSWVADDLNKILEAKRWDRVISECKPAAPEPY